MKRILFLSAVMSITTNPAKADYITGNQLLELCASASDVALGFVTGASDLAQISQDGGLVSRTFCVRKGVTNGQIKDVVCQYVKGVPAFRDFPAATLVTMAMGYSFPCQ